MKSVEARQLLKTSNLPKQSQAILACLALDSGKRPRRSGTSCALLPLCLGSSHAEDSTALHLAAVVDFALSNFGFACTAAVLQRLCGAVLRFCASVLPHNARMTREQNLFVLQHWRRGLVSNTIMNVDLDATRLFRAMRSPTVCGASWTRNTIALYVHARTYKRTALKRHQW
eukprot:3980472-Amphidinium_carterae.2